MRLGSLMSLLQKLVASLATALNPALKLLAVQVSTARSQKSAPVSNL